ncbi:MAG: PAS domain-containing protein, partial [Archangium sp.]|nr:PAS domain-containing protein [Archangium sp.]
DRQGVLGLQASAGITAHLNRAHTRVRVGTFKIGRLASERLPHLTNALLEDPNLSNREWAQREGLVSFAGVPLLVDGRVVGALAIFDRTALPQGVIDRLASLGGGLAAVIDSRTHAPPEATPAAPSDDEPVFFLADAIPHQVWTAGPDGLVTSVNRRVLDYFRRTREQLIGLGWLDTVHPEDVEACESAWKASMRSGQPFELEVRLWAAAEKTYRWHVARALPQRDANGVIVQWYGVNTDVDARRRTEDRHRLLLEAGRRLSSSLDSAYLLRQVGALCVPAIADWCLIDVQRSDGTFARVHVAFGSPARAELAKRIATFHALAYPGSLGQTPFAGGPSVLIEELTAEQLNGAAMSPEHRQVMHETGPSSYVVVPLRTVERTLGIITLVTTIDSGRRLSRDDLALAEQIGTRAALALENARYVGEMREVVVQRERALAQAEFQRGSLQRIFEQAPAALCTTRGPAHVIETINPRFSTLGGHHGVAGQPFGVAFPELSAQGELVTRMNEVYARGTPHVGKELPVRLERAGAGGPVDEVYDFVFQPLIDESRVVQGIMILAIDVTEQVSARRERESMITALAQTNRELDDFASVASHDVKAPLRGIVTLATWLSESLANKVTEEERQHLDLIQNRAKRLGALVDGILLYARAGRVHGIKERVDTKALALEVVELLGAGEPAVVIAERMPVVSAERVLLQQLLMNLVSNALKYTRRPDPHIVVDCETRDDRWVFSVQDNGPGIAPAHQARIWEPFQRLEGRDLVDGTGIGLSVVKKIAESRGGTVSLRSAPGQGATFIVHWPRPASSS